jgi:hypothetical protein
MIFVAGSLLALALAWYENKFIVLDIVRRPLFLSSPTNQVALWLVRLVITYGSLAGLFFVYGVPQAGAAFVTYWLFSWATFRTYFSREVRTVAKEMMKSEGDPSDGLTEAEAFEAATRIVKGNIKTAGIGTSFD